MPRVRPMIVKTDVLGSYVCTLDWLEPRIAATKEGQLHSPTPCSEWDVETLLITCCGRCSPTRRSESTGA